MLAWIQGRLEYGESRQKHQHRKSKAEYHGFAPCFLIANHPTRDVNDERNRF